METNAKSPQHCSAVELDEFERLVKEGGEVDPKGLRRRIEKAERLVFCGSNPVLGVGAVKNPVERYKTSVFTKAGVLDRMDDHKFELGWLYVSPEARGMGVGNHLMEAAIQVSAEGGIFATTRSNNDAMHYLFQKYAFEKVGTEYKSAKGDHTLVLYVHQST
ncbi:MAG: GNAT family N-acetyltransferase [Verrucomicrobiota bacterium]